MDSKDILPNDPRTWDWDELEKVLSTMSIERRLIALWMLNEVVEEGDKQDAISDC